ncbi:hypothetical protein FA15DRAFT_666815 [Coprinopsis marcescibilis]|uniref:Uncharacterized protein n=1 Tax=Coprinopsis marcescibilis TaxID=230819 RepID=A0A5C3L256_COPMA|nr:hypothetical protein FA15DRAFT_666815 [Coprinopsis marcescibilis]
MLVIGNFKFLCDWFKCKGKSPSAWQGSQGSFHSLPLPESVHCCSYIMVNWSDPVEIARGSEAFQKIIFAFFGLYVWELFMTSDFEWSLLSRKRRFHWPLVFFFLCRYCMLTAFVGLIVSLSASSPINCMAIYTFNSWTGNMAILCASTCLMLRTIALWERRPLIIAILGVLCLAHWGLLYRGMFVVTAKWDDGVNSCVVTESDPLFLNITFFFTMGFDFVILVFTTVALLNRNAAKSGLWKMLFHDGLVYFLISFTMNCIPAVLNILDLNPIMNVIATIPAATITSIAACRAVIRLVEFRSKEVYVHSAAVMGSNQGSGRPMPPVQVKATKAHLTRPEVHVTTEHITMAEFPTSGTNSPYQQTNRSHRSSYIIDGNSAKDQEALSEKGSSFEYGLPS